MKARIDDEGTLVIEGDNSAERLALQAWEQGFADGDLAFRIGRSEPIQRDVQRDSSMLKESSVPTTAPDQFTQG